MPLTDAKIRALKPADRAYKTSDGGGLYLHVKPNGSKLWRMKYRFEGKERLLSIGPYPAYSLKEARDSRDAARDLLGRGMDPSQAKKADKRARKLAADNSFESVGREWHAQRKARWSEKHAQQVLRSLELNIFPEFGPRPIDEIEAPEVLLALRKIEARDAPEIAARVRQRVSAIFRYGVATGRCRRDPAADLSDALMVAPKANYQALDRSELPAFLKALDGYSGARYLVLGVRLVLVTATRTTETLHARWVEFDFEERLWRVPAERMKNRSEHLVPLSDQAVRILSELHELTGHSQWLFPGRSYRDQPASNMALLSIVRRIGFSDRTTVHGLRSLFSTVANESGLWSPDAIERQLAHMPRDEVRAAYNRAQHLPERRRLLEWWANYVETAGKPKVTQFKAKKNTG